MIRLLGFLLLSFLCISNDTHAELDESKKIEAVAKFLQSDVSNGGVWKNFNFREMALLFTFKSRALYAFHLQSQDSRWTPREFKNSFYLFSDKDFLGVTSQEMHAAFPVEGHHAFVFNLDSQSNFLHAFEILVHERFHSHQFTHFKQIAATKNDPLSHEVLNLMRVEELLFIDFFHSKSLQEQKEVAKDLVAISLFRRALMSSDSLKWEDQQQQMEGLAEYVSFNSMEKSALFPGYVAIDRLMVTLNGYVNDPNIFERATKARHYGVGAALAFMLDSFQVPEWQEKVSGGKSLFHILSHHVLAKKDELEERVNRVLVSYSYDVLSRETQKIVLDNQKEREDLHSAYARQQGIIVKVGKPKESSIAGQGRAERTLFLEDGAAMMINDVSRLSNGSQTWDLESKGLPYVIQEHHGMREFKVEEEALVLVDGKEITLQELANSQKEAFFRDLELKGKVCHFKAIGIKGRVSIDEKSKIIIEFY